MYYTSKVLFRGQEYDLIEIGEGFVGLYGNFIMNDLTINFKLYKLDDEIWCKSSNSRFLMDSLQFVLYDVKCKRCIVDIYEYFRLWYEEQLIAKDYSDRNVFNRVQAYVLSKVCDCADSKQITKFNEFDIRWISAEVLAIESKYDWITLRLKQGITRQDFMCGFAKLCLLVS